MNQFIFTFPGKNCQVTKLGYWQAEEYEHKLTNHGVAYELETVGYAQYGWKKKLTAPVVIVEED